MRRWLYIALGSLVAALIVFWAGYTRGLSDAATGRAQVGSEVVLAQSKAEGSANSVMLSKRADADPKFVAQETELHEAVEANSAWADQPLPADVAASLRKR